MTGQTGATTVPSQSLHPSSDPTVLSRFRCLVHTNLHTPCHAKSGGFFVHAVAEPLRLSLSVLPGPQWLDVLPNTWASASVEVLPLQYSFVTGHFRLGVSCIVPGTEAVPRTPWLGYGIQPVSGPLTPSTEGKTGLRSTNPMYGRRPLTPGASPAGACSVP